LPNSLLANELNTNGHNKAMSDVENLSIQRRVDDRNNGGVYSWYFQRPADGLTIAPYWSQQRDKQLREFPRMEGNDILAGAIASMVKWGKNLAWLVEGPQRVVNRYQEVIATSEFGDGWGALISKVLEDYFTQDKGATIELIGGGRPDGPLVGPVLGLAHLDAQFIQPTGDPTYPVLFHNMKEGKVTESHKLHATRIIRLVDMPSPDERMNGVGFCAVSRVIAASEVLLKLARYKNEKLSDMPSAGLLILNNIMQRQWEDAQGNYQREERKAGNTIWRNIMTLFSLDPAQPAKAELVSFADIPEGFDELQSTNIYISIVALAFGVDPREFWPMSQGQLGSARESEVQAEKAKGKGKADVIAMIERAINWRVLPDAVNFRFDFRNDEEDRLRAEINKIKTESIMNMWDSESYRAGLPPPINALELRQMLADNVPDYFKPDYLTVDVTDEEELSDTETEEKSYGGSRVVINDKGRMVSQRYKNTDRVLAMVEQNYRDGLIGLDDLIEFRLGDLIK
jgi:hypothetical protein